MRAMTSIRPFARDETTASAARQAVLLARGAIERTRRDIGSVTVRMLRFLLPATALALCLAPGIAHAQQPRGPRIEDRIARNHFENGNEYFRIGRYADAAREFEHAFEISHQNELLYNIGWAYELAGDLPNAIAWYERFDQSGAPGMNRDVLRERVANLRTRTSAPAGTTSAAPSGAPASTPPVSSPTPGPTLSVESSEPPAASAAPPVGAAHYEYRRSTIATIGPFVTIGAGVVLAGLGVWQGIAYGYDSGLVASWNAGQILYSPAVGAAHDRLTPELALTGVFVGLGGAAIVGGVLWHLLRGPGERVEVRAHASVFVAPAAAGVITGVGGSF